MNDTESLLIPNSTSESKNTVSGLLMAFNASVGCIVIILHLATLATILSAKKLRKRNDLIILSVYCVAEVLVGLTMATYGGLFADVYLDPSKYPKSILSTALECTSEVYMSFLVIGYNLLVAMQLVTSIDRLICTLAFLSYLNLGRKYIITVIGIPVSIILSIYLWMWIGTAQLPQEPLYPKPCPAGLGMAPLFTPLTNDFQYIMSGSSVLVYGVILVGIRFQKTSEYSALQRQQAKRQAKITKTLGIMAVSTLLFFLLPLVTFHTVNSIASLEVSLRVIPLMTAIMEFDSFGNIIVYLYRQNDVKTRMLQLFCPWHRRALVAPASRARASSFGQVS